MNYENQMTWKKIMEKLPADYQFTDSYRPAEEWWDYRGYRLHLEIQQPQLR